MKRCMYCGNENDDSSQTCSKCGNLLIDMPKGPTVPAQEVPEDGSQVPEEGISADISDIKISEDALEDIRVDLPFNQASEAPEQPWQQGQQPYGGQEQSWQQGQQPYAGQEQPWQQGQQPYGDQEQPWQQGQQPYGGQEQPWQQGQQPFGDQEQPWQQVQQQYGGQAYGYQQEVQYGYAQDAEERDYGTRMQPAGGNRTLMQTARKRVKSFLFFLMTLCYTAMAGVTVANVLFGDIVRSLDALQTTAETALGSSAAIRFMNSIIDMLEQMHGLPVVTAGVLMCAPAVLICLGLWMTFFMTSTRKEQVSTSGITLVKVVVTLKFIFYCVLVAAGLVISVAFVVAAGAASSVPSILVGAVMLVAMIVIAVLLIMFYVLLLHALKVIRANIRTGAVPGRISSFVPVMGIVLCALAVLSMLPMAPNDYLGLASRAADAVWLLIGSIWLMMYRAKVR